MVAQNKYGHRRGSPDDREVPMTATQQPDPFESDAGAVKGPSGPRAGFWRRFAASFLDGVVITLVSTPFAAIDVAAYYAVSFFGQAVYYTLLEGGSRGQTLGKRALGIRVVDLAGGGPIGYERGFIRWIGRFASGIVLLLGYLWMLWDREKQTWHDKMAGSVVVPVGSVPVD
jgi:uncharacterized RDD family membrane protein YckC